MAITAFVSKTKTRDAADPAKAREQLAYLQTFLATHGIQEFCKYFIKVRPKPKNAGVKNPSKIRMLVPLIHNRMQRSLSSEWAQNNITLKMRQGGSTTIHMLERIFIPTITVPGTFSVVIGQTHTYSREYFSMANRAYRYFGASGILGDTRFEMLGRDLRQNVLHTVYSSKRELVFDFLESQIWVDSSENEEVGQGLPGVSHLLCTEVSRWEHNPEETMANITECVHPLGTKDIECTPNGMAGFFYEEWLRSKYWPKATYKPHFFPWHYIEEYTDRDHPVDSQTIEPDEKELMILHELDLAQIAWRRGKIMALRHNFREKYPEDDMSAFLTSGKNFFDREILYELKKKVMVLKPVAIHGGGDYIIYKRAIPGRRYIFGGDVAEGKEISASTSDYNAGCIIDEETGEEMASYHSQLPPEDFADEALDICKQYNNALVAVERNNHGGSFHLQVKHRRYGNVYGHKEWIKDQRVLAATGEIKPNFALTPGFPTNQKTRPIACNRLAKALREVPENWKDEGFIDEALAFVREPKKGKPEAQEGAHDDRVIARAIAMYVRAVRLGDIDPLDEDSSERYGYIRGVAAEELGEDEIPV